MLFDCCTPKKRDKTHQTEAGENDINAEDVEQNSLAREVLSEVIKKIEALEPKKANTFMFRRYRQYQAQWKICSDNIASIQNKLFEEHTPSTIGAETETIYKGLGEAITTYNNSISVSSTNVKPNLIKTLHIKNGAVDIDALKKACQDEKKSPYSCC